MSNDSEGDAIGLIISSSEMKVKERAAQDHTGNDSVREAYRGGRRKTNRGQERSRGGKEMLGLRAT